MKLIAVQRAGVLSLAVGSLVVAGEPCGVWQAPFDSQGGINGSPRDAVSWDPDGSGPALPMLVVAGTMTRVDGVQTGYIAAWNGSSWQQMASGFNRPVFALYQFDFDGSGPMHSTLLAAGQFNDSVDPSQPDFAARWNGIAWERMGANRAARWALASCDIDGAGPLAEQVIVAGSALTGEDLVARWDGASWIGLGDGFNDEVECMTTWDPDGNGTQPRRLVAAGVVWPGYGVMYFDGATWRTIGLGFTHMVYDLIAWDPDDSGPQNEQLIAAGWLGQSGAQSITSIARWNGSAWVQLGSGFEGSVFTMTTWDPDGAGPLQRQLIAGGVTNLADGVIVNNIARWDGERWHPLGAGVSSYVFALGTWDPDGVGPLSEHLVVGGDFSSAGGLPANRLALYAPCDPFTCAADMNGDLSVDSADLSILLSQFGSAVTPGSSGDANHDGQVDSADLSVLLSSFGDAC